MSAENGAAPAVTPDEMADDTADETADGTADAEVWHRLSWRMLLVDPLGMVTRLSPLFLLSLWLGTDRDNYWFEFSVLGLIMLTAFTRWISTSYSVGETHIVLKRGLFSRNQVTIKRERIRSVDTESDLYHRLLRVSIVEVGTGQQDSAKDDGGRFRLDAIATSAVEPLRDDLLRHMREAHPELAEYDEEQWGSRFGEDIARWKITWARFAPFSFIGFGVMFSLWLVTLQMGDMQDRLLQLGPVVSLREWLTGLGQPWTLLGEAFGVWLVAGVLGMLTYAIRYGKYALTDRGRVLFVQNGILRRKHVALDKQRLRGVEVHHPLFPRLLGGGRLDPIMTGTKRGNKASTLLPLAPRADVHRVATRILGTDRSVAAPLRRHPAAAMRRRITRGLFPFWYLLVLALLFRLDRGPEFTKWIVWFIVPAFVFFLLLGIDRIRNLGHGVVLDALVTSHGSLSAKRAVLHKGGIIGWRVSQTPFQRWAGVANVSAATPAGQGAYNILDMRATEAWALAEALTPGVTAEWGTITTYPRDGGKARVSAPAAEAGDTPSFPRPDRRGKRAKVR